MEDKYISYFCYYHYFLSTLYLYCGKMLSTSAHEFVNFEMCLQNTSFQISENNLIMKIWKLVQLTSERKRLQLKCTATIARRYAATAFLKYIAVNLFLDTLQVPDIY